MPEDKRCIDYVSKTLMRLKTTRLKISKFVIEDAPFILKLLNSDGFLQFIGDRGVSTLDDANNYIKNGPLKSYRKNGYGLYKMSLLDNTPIGMCGFLKRDDLKFPDLGYAILPEFSGKGFTFEAATEVLKYGRNNFGFATILAITTKENTYSINLLEKLEFRYDKDIKLSSENKLLKLFSKDYSSNYYG